MFTKPLDVDLILVSLRTLGFNQGLQVEVWHFYPLNRRFERSGKGIVISDFPSARAHIHFNFIGNLHDDVFDKVLWCEFGGCVIFKLCERSDDARVVFDILRDKNIDIHGGTDITVQPTGPSADNEVVCIVFVQQRTHAQ